VIRSPHHIHPHIEYGVRSLKPPQYTTVTTIGMKLRPASLTPEAVRLDSSLALYHQIQWREINKCLHHIGGCGVHRSCDP
jgi:hypothetical protein